MIFTHVTSTLREPAMTRSAWRFEPVVDQRDHLLDGEAVRQHDRFDAAIGRRREQFERSPPVGLGQAARSRTRGHPACADASHPINAMMISATMHASVNELAPELAPKCRVLQGIRGELTRAGRR